MLRGRIRKFGREKDQRRAFLRSLARALILKEKITTTEARAKELRGFLEPLVTKGRTNSPASRRTILSRLGGDEQATRKLVQKIAPRYKERSGGYVRILKKGPRRGDGSPMAVISFV
ncbi:MAG TPA: 50S ribosomal protein L17 [Candidatus Paceibacterota bacterium]